MAEAIAAGVPEEEAWPRFYAEGLDFKPLPVKPAGGLAPQDASHEASEAPQRPVVTEAVQSDLEIEEAVTAAPSGLERLIFDTGTGEVALNYDSANNTVWAMQQQVCGYDHISDVL